MDEVLTDVIQTGETTGAGPDERWYIRPGFARAHQLRDSRQWTRYMRDARGGLAEAQPDDLRCGQCLRRRPVEVS